MYRNRAIQVQPEKPRNKIGKHLNICLAKAKLSLVGSIPLF
jgi:hypothetical protein